MPQRVVDRNELSLNEEKYKLSVPIRETLVSRPAGKVVIGDTTKDSQVHASVLAQSDWRGGIGWERGLDASTADRCWWSTCQLWQRGHLLLPPLATQTAASGVSGSYTIGPIGELASTIYVPFGTAVRSYNNGTDSWGSTLATLPAAATDTITVRVGGTVFLIFACTTHYTRTTDGSTWEDETDHIQYLAYWDNRIWGIDATGQLKWADTLTMATTPTWLNDAQLPLADNSVNRLFVGRDAAGEYILYASTTEGLYAHDAANNAFVKTTVAFPAHPDNGAGADAWRDFIFIPTGLNIYRYNPGNTAVTSLVGPDRDHGLPQDKRGTIRKLVGSQNALYAMVDGTTAPGSTFTTFDSGHSDNGAHGTAVIDPAQGFSMVLAWNELGWQVPWLSSSQAEAINDIKVSNAYSLYRLWIAHDERIYYIPISRDIVNPNQVSDGTYAISGRHETSWFDAGQSEVDKSALELLVEVAGASATETVTVSYGLDYADSYSGSFGSTGTISADGTTSLLFPNATTPTGTTFRAIRVLLQLARGFTTTNTPDVLSVTLVYRKKIQTKLGWTATVDLNGEYKNRSPKQQRADLLTALKSVPKVEMTFRDDDDDTRNFYVDVIAADQSEQTGHDERGTSRLVMVEP